MRHAAHPKWYRYIDGWDIANTCRETSRFGGAGVQHSVCCRVWIFCPSTVSLSDVFTCFGIQISTVETPFCMLLILFQTPQNITFSHVSAACLSPIPLFLFPDVKPFAKCAKHYPVSRVVERPVFFQFHLSIPVPFQFLFQALLRMSCVFLGFVLQSIFSHKKNTSLCFQNRRVATQTLEKHRKSFRKGTGKGTGREVTNGIGKTQDIPSPWANWTGKIQDFSCFCYEGRKKIGRETHRLHKMWQGNVLRIGTQLAFSFEKLMFGVFCNK